MSKEPMTGECHGYEFVINRYWKFEVPQLDRRYDSYEQMSEALERIQKAAGKSQRVKLALAAIDCEGTPVTITGIHAGHGAAVTKPAAKSSGFLYPDAKCIADAIAEQTRLKNRLDHIRAMLEKFNLTPRTMTRFSPEKHPEWVAGLEERYTELAAQAKSLTFEQAMQQTDPPKRIRF